jgi:hypothetical protein
LHIPEDAIYKLPPTISYHNLTIDGPARITQLSRQKLAQVLNDFFTYF